ncbi:MAG: caspase family protein, partial [Bacteroidota bacterium]
MNHQLTALRRGLVYVALLLLGNCYLSGQTPNVAPQYRSYEQAPRQEVFLDAFDDNRNQWILNANRYQGQIQDGSLTISSENPKVMIQWKEVQLPKKGDFEISLRIRNVAGTEKSMAGLSFGIHEKGNRFVFWESPKGAFRVSREEAGKRYDFQPWRLHQSVKNSRYLHLNLQQRGKEWHFFLNGELVAQMPAQPLYGNGIGIAVKGPMVVKVDELRVSTLKRGSQIRDLTGPSIRINSPGIRPGKVFVSQENHVPISGTVTDPSGIKELRLGDQIVSLDKKGRFALDLPLQAGRQEKVLKAVDRVGNRSVFPLKLEYRPALPPKPVIVAAPVRPERLQAYAQEQPLGTGKDYLVLIGVDQYDNWSPLHNAVKDCEDVAQVLSEHYQFSPQYTIRIYNQQASRRGILSEFERLQKQLAPEDNLVIYYAGHGYYDEESGLGYWVPTDAQKGFVPDFIPNSTIHDY